MPGPDLTTIGLGSVPNPGDAGSGSI